MLAESLEAFDELGDVSDVVPVSVREEDVADLQTCEPGEQPLCVSRVDDDEGTGWSASDEVAEVVIEVSDRSDFHGESSY